MAKVAQLVEPQIVDLVVAGSCPVFRPNFPSPLHGCTEHGFMCLAGMDRHRPTGLTAQTVATARGKPRIPQIVGGMGAYGNTHHICSNLCNLRFPRAVRAVVASLPPNFHGLHCCNGVRGKREEAQRRGKEEKGIGGWWGSAPRPDRAKFALYPRHVLRTCLTGTRQATR